MGRRRSLLSVATAILLATALPRAAYASAPWLSDCDQAANSNKLCIYSDWHWSGSIAHMSGNNANYSGETWPSTTNAVDNSVSSTLNLYASSRVRWWNNANYSSSFICNNPNEGYYTMPFLWNDSITSHEVVAGNC
jgi:hypothetical protein